MESAFQIRLVENQDEKSARTRYVLESLPDWFGNPEAIDEYCRKVQKLPLWAATGESGTPLGLLAGTIHYGRTGEIIVMGVSPAAHHQGIGSALYTHAEQYFRKAGCSYVMVKTLSEQADFAPYEGTRQFYKAMGFAPLVTLHEMWDEENPCLIMLKTLG